MASIFSPRSLAQALDLLAEHGDALTILAGGTDLMVTLQTHAGGVDRVDGVDGVDRVDRVLNIQGLDELRGIREDGEDVVIGALETYTDIIRSPLTERHAPALVAAARTVGAVQIQNRGTLGGNFANASPAADSPPVLLSYDARIRLVSAAGERWVAATSFFRGYKDIDLRPDELIAAFALPKKTPADRELYVKVGTRRAQSISKVVLGARARMSPDGRIERAALALGSVAPFTIRLVRTEAAMAGQRPGPELEATVRRIAAAEVSPIDDVRSTATYRRRVSGNIAARFARYLAGTRGP